jgi:LytS/YehU family sensor histidine kinase
MPRPHLAIALACAVAGALQALHSLAYVGVIDLRSVAIAIGLTAIEMVVLTLAFGRRAGGARWLVAAGVAAVALGIALAFVATLVPGAPRLPAGIVAQIGTFDGLLAAGLWALAIVVPEARARALELERMRVAAELATLRTYVQPHFLMNTLNAISALVTEDPAQARELVAALGDLLRDSLDDRGETHTLAEEIAWLHRYAHVIETRHRVRFRWDVATTTERVQIPRMLLQPLVENAVKHGKTTDRPLHLLVRARVRRGKLRVTVRDDGRGIAREAIDRVLEQGVGEGTGLGLASVNLRLTAHYGDGVRLRSFPFGTVVRREVPVG